MNTKIDEPTGLTVIFKEKTNKSYEKTVKVIKDDTSYIVFLNYDEWDGYSIVWTDDNYKDIDEPAWATEYAEATSYHELAYLLDEMGREGE
jgi:hypothetical protein